MKVATLKQSVQASKMVVARFSIGEDIPCERYAVINNQFIIFPGEGLTTRGLQNGLQHIEDDNMKVVFCDTDYEGGLFKVDHVSLDDENLILVC